MRIIKKICNFLSMLLFVLLLALAGILLLPKLFGYQEYAVLSGSMEPQIAVGALVYEKKATDSPKLKPGEIITYHLTEDTLVTHRIVSVDESAQTVITKGDANTVPDAMPVAFDAVEGVYAFHLPLLGYLTIYVKTPLGISMACVVLLVMVLLNFLPEVLEEKEKIPRMTAL